MSDQVEILKKTIHGSPYIGVFSLVTEEVGIFPIIANQKDLEGIEEILGIEIMKVSIAGSPLIGAMCVALGKKIAVPDSTEDNEISKLEEFGMRVLTVGEYSALGNIFALNENGGIAASWVDKKIIKEMEKFFGVKFYQNILSKMALPGAMIVETNRGFIISPNISAQEFKKVKKVFGVNGCATTANYGDSFIGNSVIANSKGAIVGMLTTPYELLRIDEGLRGE